MKKAKDFQAMNPNPDASFSLEFDDQLQSMVKRIATKSDILSLIVCGLNRPSVWMACGIEFPKLRSDRKQACQPISVH